MALDLDGSGRNIDHGSDASLDDLSSMTAIFWAKWDGGGGDIDASLMSKDTGGFDPTAIDFNPDFAFVCQIPRATESVVVAGLLGNFAHLTLGEWMCVAVVIDLAEANADQKILVGNLSNAPEEPSSYDTQAVGSGARESDAGNNLIVGNHPNDWYWQGSVASVRILNVALSEAQIASLHRNIWFSTADTVCLTNYGFNDTGSQLDFSGQGNHGTVTGATVSDHVPLGPMRGGNRTWVVSAPVGRTTKNTDTHPLGIHTGMGWRINAP